VTHDEVEKMIGSALNKTCQLDPVPTWLVKDVGRLLSPFIALLFNKSLVSGIFPSDFKHAVVRPLLKKNGLDVSDPKNFRPVTNLSFLSKVLERIQRRTVVLVHSQQKSLAVNICVLPLSGSWSYFQTSAEDIRFSEILMSKCSTLEIF